MSYRTLSTLFLLPAIAVLSGCVSTNTVAVDRNALAGFNGGTIAFTQREKPTFAANTAGKAALGAFGLIGGAIQGAATTSSGNAIINENNVADPAVSIRQALLTDLVRDEGLNRVDTARITDTADVAALAKQYSEADLLLDVQTINWSFIYFPTNWSHYRVIYSAKLRLIDTKHGTLLADSFCSRVPEETPDAPTREELLDNQAAGLKKQLEIAADHCINEFRSKALLQNTVAQVPSNH